MEDESELEKIKKLAELLKKVDSDNYKNTINVIEENIKNFSEIEKDNSNKVNVKSNTNNYK